MKKKFSNQSIFKYILILCLYLSLQACKEDFLEITPKGNLIAKTTEDYDLLLNNLSLININTSSQFLMGDDVSTVLPYFNSTTVKASRQFKWSDIVYEDDEIADEMNIPMQNIYLYNSIINEVLESEGDNEQKKLELQAEAKAGRAWTNFLLINFYGAPYEESTASTALGFPIITEADVTQNKFTRSTVKEMYDFIIKDLSEAIENLPENLSHRTRMSKVAAEALLGKVYIFMNKPELALPLLNNALSGISNGSIPVELYDYNTAFISGGSFFPVSILGPTYPTTPNNKENLYSKQFSNFWTFIQNEYVMSEQTTSLFNSSDLRLKFFSSTAFLSPVVYPDNLKRKIGIGATQFGVMLPDLILLRAEANARLNNISLAKKDVESLRIKRMPESDAIVPATALENKDKLTKFIMEERQREFALTGFRWFDMRRNSVDPLFSNNSYKHYVYNADGSIAETYTLNTKRFLIQFPIRVINANPGFQNNP